MLSLCPVVLFALHYMYMSTYIYLYIYACIIIKSYNRINNRKKDRLKVRSESLPKIHNDK